MTGAAETHFPARWWHALDDGRIQCDLCPRDCRLHEGQRGLCFVRAREGDAMVLTTYGRSSGFCIDPIEKKPLFHFHPGSTVLYPSDPNQAAQLIQQMCDLEGISYIRTTREKLPVIYQPTDTFAVGGSKTLKTSAADKLAIVAAGITVHEALHAAEQLAKEGIAVRVIDAYSIKPIDKMTMRQAAKDCGKIITVEFHAFWEAVLGGLLVLGAIVVLAFNANGVHELTIFAAVLMLQSLPFLSAAGLAAIEGSRLNEFATWRALQAKTMAFLPKRATAATAIADVTAPAPEKQPETIQ